MCPSIGDLGVGGGAYMISLVFGVERNNFCWPYKEINGKIPYKISFKGGGQKIPH